MAYKSKEIYKFISGKTGFPVKTIMEIDDLTIDGVYSLRALSNKYLSKPLDIGKVIDMLTDADKLT